MLSIVLAIAIAVVLFDFMASRAMPKRPVRIVQLGAPLSAETPVLLVFPGFSNPAHQLGLGISSIIGPDKSVLVVDYGTAMDDDEIYDAVYTFLDQRYGAIFDFNLYGHSMGGQVGAMFRQRYVQEGSRLGPINHFIMDCSPMRASSLQTPVPLFIARLLAWLVWPGIVLQGLIALGHIVSRITMHPELDKTVNRRLYRSYANAMTLFSARAWLAQIRYMLRFGKKLEENSAEVVYICSENPKRDKLVKQLKAIEQWQQKLYNFVRVPAPISHAWPMEQPVVYSGIFERVWKV